MSDVLVIKSNCKYSPKNMEKVRESLINQKAEGIAIISFGFDVIYIPEDVDIRVEEKEGLDD